MQLTTVTVRRIASSSRSKTWTVRRRSSGAGLRLPGVTSALCDSVDNRRSYQPHMPDSAFEVLQSARGFNRVQRARVVPGTGDSQTEPSGFTDIRASASIQERRHLMPRNAPAVSTMGTTHESLGRGRV